MKWTGVVVFCVTIGFSVVFGQNARDEKDLLFTPAEVESMLFLYNQTSVKGADVEMIAPLGVKLRAGLNEARALQDSTKSIKLKLIPVEVQLCLGIIENSTFEAKYAELVLGMKRKLQALMPPVQPGTLPVQPAQKKGESR